jgi:hypothetical protein
MSAATTGLADPPIQGSNTISQRSTSGGTATSSTFTADFEKERSRLSGRPLRRPVRRPTAVNPEVPETPEEEAARKALQRRMPSRERIRAIIDRRPDPDPWLDDKYDWRP